MVESGITTQELDAITVVEFIVTFPVPPVGDMDIPLPAVIRVTPLDEPPPPVAALKTNVLVAADVIVMLIPLKFIKLPVLAENWVVLSILTDWKLLGKFWYVVADIVFAVNPFVKFVAPFTVPPVKFEPVVPVKFTPKFG